MIGNGSIDPGTLAVAPSGEMSDADTLISRVDLLRAATSLQLDSHHKAQLSQYFTPAPVAEFMASMARMESPEVRILDAGAGVGSLFAAGVATLCRRVFRPERVSVLAYEIDGTLLPPLRKTIDLCRATCEKAGIEFSAEIRNEDFIEDSVAMLKGGLFARRTSPPINFALLNPPYSKIHSRSKHRKLLRMLGVETSNLYTGFLAAAISLLDEGGELVAITPRSFCNGPYYRPFREILLSNTRLQRLHVFESRQQAFEDEGVLQENVILHAVKGQSRELATQIAVSTSTGPEDDFVSMHDVPYDEVVHPGDPESFIRIIPDGIGQRVREMISILPRTLKDLDLNVSTGRVVEFRAREFLRFDPTDPNTVPLIHPLHLVQGNVCWPGTTKKRPTAIVSDEQIANQLVPNEHYVLVKRFSAKEEKRRVVAAVHNAAILKAAVVGFENHLNYFHRNGKGLDLTLARGLAAFLNSTLVDSYFRQFSGHTQVNVADLKSLRYPDAEQLTAIGSHLSDGFVSQSMLDELVSKELMPPMETTEVDPIQAKRRIDEAREVLTQLGLPEQQRNERSALTLLALLDLKPDTPWSEADNPLRGITPMMEFFAKHYGKSYAPNTRETVRRQTVHQFLDGGLVHINPDDPERPVNSANTVYQIESSLLGLLRTFGTEDWEKNVATYLESVETLKTKYAEERRMVRIPVSVAPNQTVSLSQGGQNILVERIVNSFLPYFVPHSRVIYLGDTEDKFAFFQRDELAVLGVELEPHGKMPDLVVYEPDRNWLVLFEAVTSHGPINSKRKEELRWLFQGARADLVFVTAFLTRKAMVKFLSEIAWETEVWVADSPTHPIHFNGERFLGPYQQGE